MQRLTHWRQKHAQGEAAKPKAGEHDTKARGENYPAIVYTTVRRGAVGFSHFFRLEMVLMLILRL
jgi:hypothetical protein